MVFTFIGLHLLDADSNLLSSCDNQEYPDIVKCPLGGWMAAEEEGQSHSQLRTKTKVRHIRVEKFSRVDLQKNLLPSIFSKRMNLSDGGPIYWGKVSPS